MRFVAGGAVAERHREDETGMAESDSTFVAKTVVGVAGTNKVVYKNQVADLCSFGEASCHLLILRAGQTIAAGVVMNYYEPAGKLGERSSYYKFCIHYRGCHASRRVPLLCYYPVGPIEIDNPTLLVLQIPEQRGNNSCRIAGGEYLQALIHLRLRPP